MSKILDSNYIKPETIDMKDVYEIEDVELQLKTEAERILKAKSAKKQQQDQMSDMRDTQYYSVVVFANKNDKDRFINGLKDVDIEGDTFIDGYQLAKKIGLNIEMSASLPAPHYVKQFKVKQNGNQISRKNKS
jgi:hypothetical protein